MEIQKERQNLFIKYRRVKNLTLRGLGLTETVIITLINSDIII